MRNCRDAIQAVTLVVGVLAAVVWPTLPAAADPGERIPTYDVVLAIRPDGVLHVRETITYDFDGRGEHGIVRRVPYRVKNRLYDICNVRTSSSTGAPARADAAKVLHELRITVGDGRRTVRGRQAYVIEYDVAGALTTRRNTVELRWDATGVAWSVPIGEVSIRVEAPVPPHHAACWAGAARTGLTQCRRDRDGPHAIDFTQTDLSPQEGALVHVLLPEGAVTVPPPRYARPHFAGSWLGYALLAVGLTAAAVAKTTAVPGTRRPRRAVGAALLVTGASALLGDALSEVFADGIWAFSIGDLALAGGGLLASGVVVLLTGRTRMRGEAAVNLDQRA
jgi:predicted membrane protein DUF2207